MKLKSHDLYLIAALILTIVIIGGAVSYCSTSATYDEPAHRAAITEIYPSVHWPEYRDAARDVCNLSEGSFRLVAAMAKDDGLRAIQAMSVSTVYLCPERLKLLEK